MHHKWCISMYKRYVRVLNMRHEPFINSRVYQNLHVSRSSLLLIMFSTPRDGDDRKTGLYASLVVAQQDERFLRATRGAQRCPWFKITPCNDTFTHYGKAPITFDHLIHSHNSMYVEVRIKSSKLK